MPGPRRVLFCLSFLLLFISYYHIRRTSCLPHLIRVCQCVKESIEVKRGKQQQQGQRKRKRKEELHHQKQKQIRSGPHHHHLHASFHPSQILSLVNKLPWQSLKASSVISSLPVSSHNSQHRERSMDPRHLVCPLSSHHNDLSQKLTEMLC